MTENQRRAEQLDRDGLLDLWEKIKSRETSEDGWGPGMAFDHLVIRAFQLEGVPVRWPYRVTYPDHR